MVHCGASLKLGCGACIFAVFLHRERGQVLLGFGLLHLRVDFCKLLLQRQLLLLELHLLLRLGLLHLHVGLIQLHLLLGLLALELHALRVQLHALLRRLHGHLRWVHRGRLLELLDHLLRLLDDWRQVGEDVTGLFADDHRRLGQHAIECTFVLVAMFLLAQLVEVNIGHALGQIHGVLHVPERDVFLEVVDDAGDERLLEHRPCAEHRVHHEAEVRLDVRDVVLLREGHDWAAQCGRDVFVHGVLLLGLDGWVEQAVIVGDLQRGEDALLDLALVVQLRQHLRTLRHCLHLSVTLRLGEDVRVADRHDVHRAFEVGA